MFKKGLFWIITVALVLIASIGGYMLYSTVRLQAQEPATVEITPAVTQEPASESSPTAVLEPTAATATISGATTAQATFDIVSLAEEPTQTPVAEVPETVTTTATTTTTDQAAPATATVEATATPAPTSTPTATPTSVVISDWRGEYYDNPDLSGDPDLVRNDTSINFNWGTGSPDSSISSDGFSVRWSRSLDLDSGTYRFYARVDDGVRLWIDDDLVIDEWEDGAYTTYTADVTLDDGSHWVVMEYYEDTGGAAAKLSWDEIDESSDESPKAVLDGPYTVNEGAEITFDGSDSEDSDGSIVKYEWDLDYSDGDFDRSATGSTVTTSFADGPETVTVALRVTDDDGDKDIDTARVTVLNVAPAVEAGGPYSGQVGTLTALVGTATDPSSADQVALTYRWDLGDGTQSSGRIVSHSYDTAGTYQVTLTVTDKDGAQATDTAAVQVWGANRSPTAVISGPTSGLVGETLSFDGSGSSDPDGQIVSYAWDLGDGTTASGTEVSHSYGAAGSYQVTLTVTDDDGLSGSATRTVKIGEPASNQAPTAVISGPTSSSVYELLSFSGSGSSDSDGQIVSYAWDLGDGTTASGAEVSHSYNVAGSYQVTLTVTDDDGLSSSVTLTVQVEEPGTPAMGRVTPTK